jgi:hypothetical protein
MQRRGGVAWAVQLTWFASSLNSSAATGQYGSFGSLDKSPQWLAPPSGAGSVSRSARSKGTNLTGSFPIRQMILMQLHELYG